MNKNELVAVVVNELNNNIQKKDVERVVNTFIDVLKNAILHQKVSLTGFITFSSVLVQAREGHMNGKPWSTPEKYTPKAKFSDSYKKQMARKV